MFWASKLDLLPSKLKITSWLYPAAGEAHLPETDGKMPHLKRRRHQAIAAKAIVNRNMPNAHMAITPATNVACMKYNGGGDAETICMIDLGNDKAKKARPKRKPNTLSGIASIHYMEAQADGVRVWNVGGIGPGRLVSWEETKKYFHKVQVVDPCVPLVDVPAAVDPHRVDVEPTSNELKPKIHRSHQNVKARKKMRKLRAKEKRRERELKYQRLVQEYQRKFDDQELLRCKCCSKMMSSIESLKRHQTGKCTIVKGNLTADAAAAAAVVSVSNEDGKLLNFYC